MLSGSMKVHGICRGKVPLVADYPCGTLPRNMPILYVWFVVNSGETSKGSIPGERLWVGV